MEIVVKRDELNTKLVEMLTSSLLANASQQNLDQEEVNAHLVLNRKKIQADADQITNLVFSAYGYVIAE